MREHGETLYMTHLQKAHGASFFKYTFTLKHFVNCLSLSNLLRANLVRELALVVTILVRYSFDRAVTFLNNSVCQT